MRKRKALIHLLDLIGFLLIHFAFLESVTIDNAHEPAFQMKLIEKESLAMSFPHVNIQTWESFSQECEEANVLPFGTFNQLLQQPFALQEMTQSIRMLKKMAHEQIAEQQQSAFFKEQRFFGISFLA